MEFFDYDDLGIDDDDFGLSSPSVHVYECICVYVRTSYMVV